MSATNAAPPASTGLAKTDSKAVGKTRPIDTFRELLDKLKPQLQMALPKHVDVGRMIRICVTTLQRNPDLLACTQESVLGCLFQCAQLGLEPDGLLGHAYLIPFRDNKNNRTICTLIVGYKGLLKLARQSNEIQSISARVVYSKDEFEYEFGLEDKLVHKPTLEEDPGEMTFAYAIFRYKGGGYHFDVMSKVEIEAIRKRSKTGNNGPWVTDYDEMAKKTVLRRASKMAPASIEDLSRAIALDSRSEAGIAPSLDIDMPAAPVPGSEDGNQGRRMSLGKPAVVTVPAEDEPEHDPKTGEVKAEEKPAAQSMSKTAPTPATGIVMSTSKQRKALGEAIFGARLEEGTVCKWFGVDELIALSGPQVEDALARIKILEETTVADVKAAVAKAKLGEGVVGEWFNGKTADQLTAEERAEAIRMANEAA